MLQNNPAITVPEFLLQRCSLLAMLVLLASSTATCAQDSSTANRLNRAAIDRSHRAFSAVADYREQNAGNILADLKSMLALPNVSSDQEDIRRNATYLQQQFQSRGFDMELLELDGANPVVYGVRKSPGAKRTIMIYAHFDGQPVDPARWQTTEPFQPALYTDAIESGGRKIPWPKNGDDADGMWRVYGRSASDDKGIILALLAALDALAEGDIAITSNIKLFLDGEEEIGSPNMLKCLTVYEDRFSDVDFWLFCDGPVHQSRTPSLYYGVRGICGMDITVYGATRNLHSGHYGNWAPNPAMILSRLLAGMKDENDRVTIPGFYDSITPLTETEQQAMSNVPPVDAELRNELGLNLTENENEPYIQRMQLPSLNIRGLSSATVGSNARNIVPNTARASIDIRLVKGNDPGAMIKLVEQHIAKQGFLIVREPPNMKTRRAHPRIAMVNRRMSYPAARSAMNHPQLEPVARQLKLLVGDDRLLQIPSLGGSLPLYLVTEYQKKPLVILPMANHDNNQHAPDENLRVENLMYAIDAMGAVLTMPK